MKKKDFKRLMRMVIRAMIAFKALAILGSVLVDEPVREGNILIIQGPQPFRLPDGSKGMLDERSTLICDTHTYNEESRIVRLTGRAFFQVKQDSCVPFIVHSRHVTTRVLGTSFDVDAPSGESEIRITVRTGKVNVNDGNQSADITLDQQIAVNTVSHTFVRQDVKADTVLAWMDKYDIKVPLEEIMRRVEKKFNVRVVFENENSKKILLHTGFLDDAEMPLDNVLKMAITTTENTYTITNGVVTIK